jgi:transcriptional regulator with XRE-family HTH domain
MVNFVLALPNEVCSELARRARARRLALNVSVDEMAQRVGISNKTLGNFERSGRCTLETFVRILESLNAMSDLSEVLVMQSRSIEEMRQKAEVSTRQRAYNKVRRSSQ